MFLTLREGLVDNISAPKKHHKKHGSHKKTGHKKHGKKAKKPHASSMLQLNSDIQMGSLSKNKLRSHLGVRMRDDDVTIDEAASMELGGLAKGIIKEEKMEEAASSSIDPYLETQAA